MIRRRDEINKDPGKYFHKFEVRWSDIDANRHLSNSSYMMFCAQARMAFMNANGMRMAKLVHFAVGPVIMHEDFTFYREITADQNVYVSVELTGLSEDAAIFGFTHKFYTPEGVHCATSNAIGVWIDEMMRKVSTHLPDEIADTMKKYRTYETKVLTLEDVKSLAPKPENVDITVFS